MLSRSSFVVGAVLVWALASVPGESVAQEPQYLTSPDQYIITFRDGMTRQEVLSLTKQLTAKHRLRLRHTFKDTVKGFSATFPPGVIEKIQGHPDITAIEANGIYFIEGSRPVILTVDAPTDLTATPNGDSQIDLTWTDNATTEQGTEIQRSTTGIGGTYTRLDLVFGANLTSYSDTDVTVGQEYCYQVRVGEGGGVIGAFSDATCATIEDEPPTDPPAAPSGLTATTVDDQRIDLDWTDNSDNENGFSIERATGAGGAFSEIDLVGANVTDYEDTALASNTEYCYRVYAYNDIGDSAFTAEVCATTDDEPPVTEPLGAPTNFTADGTETTVELDWTDNATEELGFQLQRSSTGIGGTYTQLAILGANSTSYTDNSVTADTEYCYQIRAGRGPNDFGDFSAQVCATPGAEPPSDPPAAPSGLGTTVVSESRIDLDWTDNSDNEDGFEVERAEGAGGAFSQIDVLGAGVTTYVDSSLASETEYCYRVRAYNTVGDSDYTAEVCATTLEEPDPGECTDAGNHDDLTDAWGIDATDADLNATWQAAQTAGCEIDPWFFGIDTGVDSDHSDLNVAEIQAFLAADPGHDGEDDHGHGTHTAGSAAAIDGNGGVAGMAPGASVYGFKVCDSLGQCAIDDIVAAVDEVTARKNANPDQDMVANMSLGGGISETQDIAVRRSVNAGVVYALSAGNGSLGACLFPADSQNQSPARTGDDLLNADDTSGGDTAPINGIITTTSHDVNNNDVNCNFGDPVTVAAPGDNISLDLAWMTDMHSAVVRRWHRRT